MKTNQLVSVVVAVLLLSGCAPVYYAAYPATYIGIDICSGPVEEVAILKAFPVNGYRRCGLMQGGVAGNPTSIKFAKEEARRYGANAIVVIEPVDAKRSLFNDVLEGSGLAIRVE